MSINRNSKSKKYRQKNAGTDNHLPEIESAEQGDASLLHDPFVHIFFILVAGFAVYFNIMAAPFVFDDPLNITDNPIIKNFDCFPNIKRVYDFAIDEGLLKNIYMRPVSYFTFAVNYAIHGLNPFGYHLASLLIHVCNAMMVYLLFSRILAAPVVRAGVGVDTGERAALWYLPLFASLIFVCHPIQTQAVTYITQRYVTTVTFFYLGAVILYDISRRSATPKKRIITYFMALGATVLAMGSKENAFTLPVVIFMYELFFFEGAVVARFIRTVPFMLTMCIIPLKLIELESSAHSHKSVGLQNAILARSDGNATAFEYLMTQFGVIATYIRLLFLPVGQNLDYDIPVQRSFFSLEVIVPLLLLLAIVAGGIWLLRHSKDNRCYRVVAFGVFWFFIALSVESSVIFIPDLILEHRVYLPFAGFLIALLAGIDLLYRRYVGQGIATSKVMTIGFIIIVIAFSFAAIARNRVWQNNVTLWRDVVQKSPNKGRAHINLGAAIASPVMDQLFTSPLDREGILRGINIKSALTLEQEKVLQEAVEEFSIGIKLFPGALMGYANIAEALILQNKFDEALKYLDKVVMISPTYPIPYMVRGKMYEGKGELSQAAREYLEAIRVQPLFSPAHLHLARVLAFQGKIQEAIAELEIIMRINPDDEVKKKLEELKRK